MAVRRCVIVNADDFGLSEGTNAGIIAAHERGIVTSASLMVRQPAVAAAADWARAHPAMGVGLHLDLGEWTLRDGEWVRASEVVAVEDRAAVAAEVRRQLATFLRLMGRAPTHLDSHQHVHRQEPVRDLLQSLGAELRVPVRGCSAVVSYCGDFYGQGQHGAPFPEGIGVENLLAILDALPSGATELGCHPGLDESLASTYCPERLLETATLCDPRIRERLAAAQIDLVSFREVGIQ